MKTADEITALTVRTICLLMVVATGIAIVRNGTDTLQHIAHGNGCLQSLDRSAR
jgi:hypothetical protein